MLVNYYVLLAYAGWAVIDTFVQGLSDKAAMSSYDGQQTDSGMADSVTFEQVLSPRCPTTTAS